MTPLLITIFVAVFLTLFALFLGLRAAWRSPAAELKRRLRRMAAKNETTRNNSLSSELLRQPKPYEKLIGKLPLMGGIKRWVEHSGVRITPSGFLFLSGTAALAGFVATYLLSGKLPAALLALLVLGGVPFAFLGYRKQQRQTRFDEQFPDALTMVSRSLRAGHSLAGAIELISMEMPEPAGGLFRIAYEQQQLGMRMSDSLRTLPDRIESVDLHFFVTIIRINSETGGNLAEILDKLADTVRARLQIRRQVQVYTAEGRMSGYVLVLLPVFVFIAFYFMKPDYMKVFFTERTCQIAILAALLAQFAGFLMIRKIVDIRI